MRPSSDATGEKDKKACFSFQMRPGTLEWIVGTRRAGLNARHERAGRSGRCGERVEWGALTTSSFSLLGPIRMVSANGAWLCERVRWGMCWAAMRVVVWVTMLLSGGVESKGVRAEVWTCAKFSTYRTNT